MNNILIVDDHPSIRTAIRIQLENVVGIGTITEADNGHMAIECMRKERFSLVLVDLDIPRMNGLELISRIRTLDTSMRILVISGQDECLYASRTRMAGANGFISKRNEIREITRAIEMVLSGFSCFPVNAMAQGNRSSVPDTASTLTNKELAILRYLAEGFSNKEIADKLFISNKTVSTHKTRIMEKLNAGTLVELIDYARRHNITILTA